MPAQPINQKQQTLIKDPLWDATPELGLEGLIATIDDPAELLEALRSNSEKNKQRKLEKN